MDIQHENARVQSHARDLERAWAAGFFDGEGNTSGKFQITVSIAQVNKNTLDRFHNVVGVGTMTLKKASGSSRPIWTLRAYSSNVVKFLNPIWPYLSDEKRLQALRALYTALFRKLRKPPNHLRNGWKVGTPPIPAIEYGLGVRQYVPTEIVTGPWGFQKDP